MTDIPRRKQIDQMTPIELAIQQIILEIEKLPEEATDGRLFSAICYLSSAQRNYAAFVDGEDHFNLRNQQTATLKEQIAELKLKRGKNWRLRSILCVEEQAVEAAMVAYDYTMDELIYPCRDSELRKIEEKAMRFAMANFFDVLWRPIDEGLSLPVRTQVLIWQPAWAEPALAVRHDYRDGPGWVDALSGDRLRSATLFRFLPRPPINAANQASRDD